VMDAFKVVSCYFTWREIKVAIDSCPIRAAREKRQKSRENQREKADMI